MTTNPNRRGSRSCLDEQKRTEICAIVAVGCTIRTAAAYVGCSDDTVYYHARKNPEFAAALKKAKAQHEIVLLRHVHEAATRKGEWHAASWLLRYCHPDRYAQKTEGLTPEQLAAALSRFADELLREIIDVKERRRIAARLEDLTANLTKNDQTAKQLEEQT